MKTTRRLLFAFALIALPTVPLGILSGCASTPTRESTGEYIDDSTITTKVKSAMFADKTVSGFAVKVETFKGTVQLSGFVDSLAQKQQAEILAARVRGVVSVDNKITVKTE
jgi:hyperosmotically inducible periplasmic protein